MPTRLPIILLVAAPLMFSCTGELTGSTPAINATSFARVPGDGDPCPEGSPASLSACCTSLWGQASYQNVAPERYACADECNYILDEHPEWASLHHSPSALCDVLLPDRSGELWSRFDPPGQEERFSDITAANADGACDAEGFEHIDHCFNQALPPRPSIERRVGTSRRGDPDDGVARYDGGRSDSGDSWDSEERPQPGDTQILPFDPHSRDGMLHLRHPYRNWPSFAPFRPERIDYDVQTRNVAPDNYDERPNNTYSAFPMRGASLHGLAYFDPSNTAFDVDGADAQVTTLKSAGFVDTLHSTLCINSGTGVNQTRDPVPCSARYGRFNYELDPDAPAEEEDNTLVDGLCYRVTYLASASSTTGASRTELRSAPVTVFVPDAMSCTAGNGSGTGPRSWIYPDNPGQVFDTQSGHYVLPDFAPYDLARLFPWDFSSKLEDYGDVSIADFGTVDSIPVRIDRGEDVVTTHQVPARCYSSGTTPNPNAPAWCEFLYNQRRSSEFHFDTDLDANPERSGVSDWDGTDTTGVLRGTRLFELVTTGDGQVLVLNAVEGFYYSTNSVAPCDASGFSSYLPISLMPVDEEMARYPVAHPDGGHFRDPSGQEIPLGSIGRYAYGWIDRDGRNVFFAAYNERRETYRAFDHQIQPVFVDGRNDHMVPVRNEDHLTEETRRGLATGAGHQVAVMGAWTRGKMVLLDNGLNASNLGGRPVATANGSYMLQYNLPLYANGTLHYTPLDVSLIESFENRLNQFDALRPTLPFDVVWTMVSNNQHVSEVAFDEYMNEQAFVVAHMNVSASHDHGIRSNMGASAMEIDDGFISSAYFQENSETTFNTDPNRDFGGQVRVQNAAGASSVQRLTVRGGARVEPVALGGVLGRGLFLDGQNDHIQFTYPSDGHHAWYVGMFVDLRDGTNHTTRALFHFPDGSWIGLRRGVAYNDYELVFVEDEEVQAAESLGTMLSERKFIHLGLRLESDGGDRTADVFVNGTYVAHEEFDDGFDLMPSSCSASCTVTIGAPEVLHAGDEEALGIRGWVDELKVYRLRPEDELFGWFDEQICNTALGTLAVVSELPPGANGDRLRSLANRFEDISGFAPPVLCEQMSLSSHERPTDIAPQHGSRVCADRVHRNGQSAACIRTDMLQLPDLAPLEERADDTENAFCTSCHFEASATPGLRLGAIEATNVPRYLDARRQPLDHPAFLVLPHAAECSGPDPRWYCGPRDAGSSHQNGISVPMDFFFDEADYIEPHGCPSGPGGAPIVGPPDHEEEQARAPDEEYERL